MWAKVSKGTQKYVKATLWVHKATQECAKPTKSVTQKCAKPPATTRSHLKLLKATHKCAKPLTSVQSHSQVCKATHKCAKPLTSLRNHLQLQGASIMCTKPPTWARSHPRAKLCKTVRKHPEACGSTRKYKSVQMFSTTFPFFCFAVQKSVARFEGGMCKSYSMDSLMLSKRPYHGQFISTKGNVPLSDKKLDFNSSILSHAYALLLARTCYCPTFYLYWCTHFYSKNV